MIPMHHYFIQNQQNMPSLTWEQDSVTPFNELIVSWNALRPQSGEYKLSIALKIDEWSDWYPYIYWGAAKQHGVDIRSPLFHIYQDTVEVLQGKQATGFRIRIEHSEGASICDFYSLHAYTGNSNAYLTNNEDTSQFSTLNLKVPLTSQLLLPHPRCRDLCSPTSTTAVMNFLSHSKIFDPVSFASLVRDTHFDIFGNWVLNAAQVGIFLEKQWMCLVQRLNGFNDIYAQLKQNIPVVVSVKGPLNGGALPYLEGHLIVVKGFDTEKKRVLCMDPGFPSAKETDVSYAFNDFMDAWARRRYLAYLFSKRLFDPIK